TVSQRTMLLPADLFLVVKNQMFGVVSQLLRRRLSDAQALTRRAIEATAAAYRLWEHPELAEVLAAAYPDVKKTGDKKQWKPSKCYKEEFSTTKLFDPPGETWERLKTLYEVFSAMASHAGPGATTSHEFREKIRYAPFLAPKEEDIRRTWHTLLAAY